MVFLAMATPIERPAPPNTLPAIAADTARTLAWMVESLSASSVTLPWLSSALSSTDAFALPRMTLLAKAPAPLRLPPTRPSITAADAANVVAWMAASSWASMTIEPVFVLTPVVVVTPAIVRSLATPMIDATTSLSISL